MCDTLNHQHAKLEEWITPETSRHLSAKMVHLWPWDSIPEHSTGPGREEVITCIYGSILVTVAGDQRTIASGEALFIPENTRHAVANADAEAPAQYCYVVTKKQPCPACGGNGRIMQATRNIECPRCGFEKRKETSCLATV